MRVPKSFRIVLVLVVSLCPFTLFGQAPVSDDTFATAGRRDNWGSAPFLALNNQDSTAYIRFDLSRLPSGLTGDQVTKATVRLFVDDVDHSGSFEVKRVTSLWNEQSLDGKHLPTLGMTDASGVAVSKDFEQHYLIVDITGLVRDWINNKQPNYGIALVPVGNVAVSFDSKENFATGHDPELDVVLAEGGGTVGPQGPAGPQGPSGPMGPAGPMGMPGLAGLTGATGPAGPAGPVGLTGATGPAGLAGPAGPVGLTGATGPAGSAGPVGLTGATGPMGPAGPMGLTGVAGPAGPAGPVGLTGATGPMGPAGSMGLTGVAGPAGPAGPIGLTGATGPMGPSGPMGLTGVAGPAGAAGPIGLTGATGSAGPAGPIGLTGATGPTGAAGATGAMGPAGATGPQGPAGPQGSVGPQGLAGSTGGQGPAGPQGTVGPQGPIGPQGPAGPVDYPGSGSLTVNHVLSPNTAINLSAEGLVDWFAPAGTTNATNYHSKILGGQIENSFNWIVAGQAPFTQGSSFTINSLASDDASGLALTSFGTDQGVFTSSQTTTGFGFRFRAPASSSASRTLKIYCSAFSAGVVLTARLTDGSAVDATDSVDTGAGGYNYFVWTVSYQAARDGQELEVSGVVTVNHASSPNVKFIAATVQ